VNQETQSGSKLKIESDQPRKIDIFPSKYSDLKRKISNL
jgi:hypothetical protein